MRLCKLFDGQAFHWLAIACHQPVSVYAVHLPELLGSWPRTGGLGRVGRILRGLRSGTGAMLLNPLPVLMYCLKVSHELIVSAILTMFLKCLKQRRRTLRPQRGWLYVRRIRHNAVTGVKKRPRERRVRGGSLARRHSTVTKEKPVWTQHQQKEERSAQRDDATTANAVAGQRTQGRGRSGNPV